LSECIQIVKTVLATKEAKKRLTPELQGKGVFSAMTVWHYKAEGDPEHRCEACDSLDGKDFLGSSIRTMFPDMMIVDAYQIYVNYHETLWNRPDTCKCYLWREEEPSAQVNLYNASTIFGDDEL
jgi:hypothetical protein